LLSSSRAFAVATRAADEVVGWFGAEVGLDPIEEEPDD
jgi:hypothetical protein